MNATASALSPDLLDEVLKSLIPTATGLICAVKDRDADDVDTALSPLTDFQVRALAVLLAAMIPDDRSVDDLLAWTHVYPEIDEQKAAENRAKLLEAVGVVQVPDGMKLCKGCDQVQQVEFFHRDRTRPDGRAYRCRDCYYANRSAVA